MALSIAVAMAGAACTDDASERDTVVLWAMGTEAEVADQLLDGFRAEHPTIPVRVQALPWSAAHEKLLTAFVGDSMPDVFQLGNTWVPELAMLGALEPLDDRIEASTLVTRSDYFEGSLVPNELEGRLLALPWYVDTRLLFYRRDLLEQVGVTDAPRTWEEWRVAMKRVRDAAPKTGADSRYGVFLPIEEWQTPVILSLQQGAQLLRDDDSYGNFRSPEVRRAVEFYVGLFRSDLAPQKSDAQVANIYREFAAGYFAYFVTGPWNLAELSKRLPTELADAWATAPMPAPSGPAPVVSVPEVPVPGVSVPGVSVSGGASLAISATSTRKDSAWKLVEYLSSTPMQVRFYSQSGDLPPRRSAWQAPELANDPRTQAFRTQLDHLASTPKIPEWERIAAKMKLHLERIVRGDASVDEALAELDADVDAILAKRRALRGKA